MDKVTALRKPRISVFGTDMIEILYWYTISPRIQDSLTNDIAPLTIADIPTEAVRYVSPADQTLIANGDAGFEKVGVSQTGGETNGAFLARVLADHTVREAAWVQEQRDIWALAGTGRSV